MKPQDLLDHAEDLLPTNLGAPRQMELRRAISASYYALFHCFLRNAANDLIGVTARAQRSAAYTLLYRAFEHARMRETCIESAKLNLPVKLVASTGLLQFPQGIRDAARAFVHLQDLRHKADYNPNVRFYKSDATSAIDICKVAIANFEACGRDAKRTFLLSML